VRLVQAFSERNEPKVVLDSMGACIVKGLNNWSRIHVRRDAWKREWGSRRLTMAGRRNSRN
jgi:hypothetical protein